MQAAAEPPAGDAEGGADVMVTCDLFCLSSYLSLYKTYLVRPFMHHIEMVLDRKIVTVITVSYIVMLAFYTKKKYIKHDV